MRSFAATRCGALLSALLCLCLSCNTNREVAEDPVEQKPGDPQQPEYALTLTPADASLGVDGKTATTLDYRVLRRGEDVTAQATLFLEDSRIGDFNGASLTVKPGASGKTRVHARIGDDEGVTTLTVRVIVIVIGPGAMPDAPTKFGGSEDAGHAPSIAYPPAGALVPPNLNELEIHWLPNSGSLFEVRFVGSALDLRIYTSCSVVGSGCVLLPDESSWRWLAQAARNDTVQLTVRSSLSGGAAVGTSAAQKLSFGNDDMKGGLYYWAASSGGLARYDFGLRGQKAEAYYGPLQAGALCVGCHALSRNGKRVAVGMNTPGPAAMRSLETATRTKLFEVGKLGIGVGSNYQAWTYDGSYLITTETGGLTVRDGTTGAVKGPNPSVANANMPDISPDSKQVVFSRNITPQCIGPLCETLSVQSATLYTVPFSSDQTFGTPVILAKADGMSNYYPSFSPDGRFVVYNRASGDSYDSTTARVMIIAANGSGSPIDLTSVNDLVGNSWPKWSPFIHRFGSSTILWLTFSSRRAYGVRPTPAAQLWMVPVDIAKLEAGQDSGYPPFRLPFQELNTGNHIAQWVETIERAPCTIGDTSGCSSGEQCVDGYCTPVIK